MFRYVSRTRWFKIVRIVIQMMIWANVYTSATQDVGTKLIGSFRVSPSFLSNWKAKTKSKKICVKIPFMVKTLPRDWKDQLNPPGPSFQGRTPCTTRGGSTWKRGSKFLKKRILMYVKGQQLSWMVSERVILSVKRTNSESKGKRLDVGWEAGSLSLRNFPRIPSAFSLFWATLCYCHVQRGSVLLLCVLEIAPWFPVRKNSLR